VKKLQPVRVRRSSRIQKPAISNDCRVYLQESDYDVGIKDDPHSFSQDMSGENSIFWYDAMKDEWTMAKNKVWDFVKLPNRVSTVGTKWVFKTKRDSSRNIE
jgi:hypothetical protein